MISKKRRTKRSDSWIGNPVVTIGLTVSNILLTTALWTAPTSRRYKIIRQHTPTPWETCATTKVGYPFNARKKDTFNDVVGHIQQRLLAKILKKYLKITSSDYSIVSNFCSPNKKWKPTKSHQTHDRPSGIWILWPVPNGGCIMWKYKSERAKICGRYWHGQHSNTTQCMHDSYRKHSHGCQAISNHANFQKLMNWNWNVVWRLVHH